MENKLITIQPGIRATAGMVEFDQYEQYLAAAQEIGSWILAYEPTEENMSDAKHMLAQARKIVNTLDQKRKDVKKEIMKPYEDFEFKIKNIIAAIDDADDYVRRKVKELEAEEKERKRETLREIFNMRARWYSFPRAYPGAFDLWMQPQYLNKTCSIHQAETEMVKWLEDTSEELRQAQDMGEEYLAEYLKVLDLAEAIANVNGTKETVKLIHENDGIDIALFQVYGASDIEKTEQFLKDNHIMYRRGDI